MPPFSLGRNLGHFAPSLWKTPAPCRWAVRRGPRPGRVSRLGVETPSVSCADSSLGAGALPRRIWNPPLRPLRQPDGCHLSRRGEASCYRRRGPGLCLPALPCFRRTSRRRGPGKPPRLCHSVSPAILGTFGAQKSRMGAGHADVLPYHSCRRHTARFLPPSQHPPGPSPAPRAVYGLPVPPPLCFFAKAAHVKLTCAATSAIISLKEVIPWN